MARSGPRYAEPENLAVDGVADHGCSGLPLRADCQRQRPEPVKQNMPGFAAPPTGPNKVGKLASANTRRRRQDSASRRRCRPPLKARVPGIDRRKKPERRDRRGQARLSPGRGRRTAAGRPPHRSQHQEAIPTALIADDKGPFGFEHGTAPRPSRVTPAPKLGPRTQNRTPKAAHPETETQAVLPQTRPTRPSTRSTDRRKPNHVQHHPPTRKP